MKNSFELESTENVFEDIESWDKKTTEKIVTSLTFLTQELKENFPHYDAVVSDDTSARLVSLFFREIINRKKEETNQDFVQAYFLTPKRGKHREINEGIDTFLSEKSEKENLKKVLIVTEHIDSGASLKPIMKSLEKNNVDFDIAAISINSFFPLKKELREKITYFSKSSDGLLFYKKRLEGVQKDKRDHFSIHPKKTVISEYERMKVNQARRDISLIAQEIWKMVNEKGVD